MCKIDRYWEPAVKARGAQLGALCGPGAGDEGNGREVQEGGIVCIHTADLLHCTVETHTAL